ncbi:hypothetical protein CSA37_09720 [Candidatus Fermentibacteria bacterium]|nr:MAG: hypothetical protein CSA37_09720 [Candidatus Fermentibacteria bacterium]
MLNIILLSTVFVPVEGFADLEAIAEPGDFAFLLVCSGNPAADADMSQQMLSAIGESFIPDTADISLYLISPEASGYSEVASLAGRINGFPAVVTLVGHCGFLELDTTMLLSEMEDMWFRWGTGGSQGICNHCTRCHP